MHNMEHSELDAARQLIGGLRAVGQEQAPATLRPNVLRGAGLADGYWPLDTVIGSIFIAYNPRGISAVEQATDGVAFEQHFQARFSRAVYPVAAPPAPLVRAVTQRLQGEPAKLDWDLRNQTPFEQAVLLKALEIPRGQVRPYGWIAREIGRPKAVRAVGTALGHNPIPLLIPCHRVVRSDGRIGDYIFGSGAKHAVLAAEGVEATTLEQWARQGLRYLGSDTTHIFCYPTCAHAKRITEQHRVPFGSERDALAAGYRPCKVCRPAVGA